MDVRPGTLELRGMYHFTCSAKQPLVASMFYPFPLDSTHLYPDSIEIRQHGFQKQDSGVSFRMQFRPGTEDSFFAYYRQPLKTNSGHVPCLVEIVSGPRITLDDLSDFVNLGL